MVTEKQEVAHTHEKPKTKQKQKHKSIITELTLEFLSINGFQ